MNVPQLPGQITKILTFASNYTTTKDPKILVNLNNYLTELFKQKYHLPFGPEDDVRIRSLHTWLVKNDPTNKLSTNFQALFPKNNKACAQEKRPSTPPSSPPPRRPPSSHMDNNILRILLGDFAAISHLKRPLEQRKEDIKVQNKKPKLDFSYEDEITFQHLPFDALDGKDLLELAFQNFAEVIPDSEGNLQNQLKSLTPNLANIYHGICKIQTDSKMFNDEIEKSSKEDLADTIISKALNLLSTSKFSDSVEMILGIHDPELKEEAILSTLELL